MTVAFRRTEFRTADTEQFALARSLETYDELYTTLRTTVPARLSEVVEEAYRDGRREIERLLYAASDSELDPYEQDLLTMYLASAGSADPEKQLAWLDMLPESLERLFARHSRSETRWVAEESATYGSADLGHSWRSSVEHWHDQPLEVEVHTPRRRDTAAAV